MIRAKRISILIASGIILLTGALGCFGQKRAAVVMPETTCSEALASGLQNYSDNEIAELLDESLVEKDVDGCWIPMMTYSLNENRDIPHRHLVEAVKVFNKRRYGNLFHKAMYRYFAALSENPDNYRPEDKRLLEEYLSYLINSAESSRDKHLRQAKLVSRKLDRNLYARLFE